MPSGLDREDWNPPPALSHLTPRAVRLTGTGIKFLAFSLLLILAGAAAIVDGCITGIRHDAAEDAEALRMRAQCRDTLGEVTRVWETWHGRYRTYWVQYQFHAKGLLYETHNSIAWAHWKLLHEGSPIAVRYLDSDPTDVYPSLDPPRRVNSWALPAVFGSSVILIGILVLRLVMLQRRILTYGECVPALVTRCGGVNIQYSYDYEFRSRDGATIKGTFDDSWNRKVGPPEGSVVSVLVDPNHPRRNAPYPVWLVKLTA